MANDLTRGVGHPVDPKRARGGANRSISAPNETEEQSKARWEKKSYSVITVPLSIAQDDQLYAIAGTFLYIPVAKDSAGDAVTDAILDIKLDSKANDPIPMVPGMFLSGIPFQGIFVTNKAQTGYDAYIMTAMDDPANRILVEGI